VLGASTGHGTGHFCLSGESRSPKLALLRPLPPTLFPSPASLVTEIRSVGGSPTLLARTASRSAVPFRFRSAIFRPGTSKWNKIEHRLFSFISSNWRGEPLRDYETVVKLISRTTTAKGLTVTCRLDRRKYPIGRQVTKEEMKRINLHPDKFHGEWNYVIRPRAAKNSS